MQHAGSMSISAAAASLPITKAARMLGVHPNTLRAWADRGRIRCLRVNERGDRRFLMDDLQAFMRAAETEPVPAGARDGTDWEAQVDSIARLGTHLNHLNSVADIGTAICHGLRELIDYHNVRVYRVEGREVVPVAWRGEIGAYTGEASDQLRLRIGEGMPVRDIARLRDEDPVHVHREYARARREFRAALRDVVASHHPGSVEGVDAECERLLDLLG